MRELVLIRTHFYNEAVDEFFEYLRSTSGRDVAIICDETAGSVDVGSGKVKVGLTQDYVRSLNLHVPGNFGWLCGDYFLYVASRALPNYDRYWMVESDVRFSLPQSVEFFDAFKNDCTDFFAFHIFKSKPTWYWHSPMCHFTSDVYACLFPVVGVSKKAIEAAYTERVRMSSTFNSLVPQNEPRRWPNDESFLLTTLVSGGFSYRSLDAEDRKFSTATTFGVGLPKSHARLAAQTPDGRIYHPVHAEGGFVNKANTWLKIHINRKTPTEEVEKLFDEKFLDDLRLEASDEDFQAFQAKLATFLSGAAP